MLKVLFHSWIGIASFSAVALTIVAVTAVLGFVMWNAENERKGK
jgi:hypothetical protein